MRKQIAGIVLALCWCWASYAGDKDSDIVRPRGGVANYVRALQNQLALPEGQRRNKFGRAHVVFLGGHFLYDPNTRVHSAHFILTPEKAAHKRNSFCNRLVQSHARELVPGSVVLRLISTMESPSWRNAFRISKRGILPHQQRGDPRPVDAHLVVLDFAYNDRNLPESIVFAGMEGLLRQVRTRFPKADILFLYAPNKGFLEDYRAGRTPSSIALHERVADHYGIPSVHLAQLVADKIIAGELREDEVFLGNGVVTDVVDALCVEAVKPLFLAGLSVAGEAPEITPHRLPASLGAYPVDNPDIVQYGNAVFEPGWLDWQPSSVDHFLHVLQCEEPGPVLTLRVKADVVGLSHVVGPDSGDLECSINGAPWELRPSVSGPRPTVFQELPLLLAEGLDPAKEHEIRLRVASGIPEGGKGTVVRIANFLVNGTVLFERPFRGMTTLQRADFIYSEMEPLTYQPPEDRWKHIPRAMRKLQEGPSIRIVMLGDSIINDTADSQFHVLLERMYPNCRVHLVRSVRSSTGCHWYKQEGRVNDYVVRHRPDLLMIGGISNRGDTPRDAVESIREVVHQVREALPHTEILLMSGPFGWQQDPDGPNWQEILPPDGDDYRSLLMRMARDEKADFIDMNGIVGRYVLDSAFPLGALLRDPIHANWRGKQLLGRILERYFDPTP